MRTSKIDQLLIVCTVQSILHFTTLFRIRTLLTLCVLKVMFSFYLQHGCMHAFHSLSGVKQSGVPLNDIVLPPWAKGDPHEFIRKHREVCNLPSTYVVLINFAIGIALSALFTYTVYMAVTSSNECYKYSFLTTFY